MPDYSRLLWSPDETWKKETLLQKYINTLLEGKQIENGDYLSLHDWSIKYPEAFWESVWNFTGIHSSAPYEKVLELGERIEQTRWFPGCQLNYAENLLIPRNDKLALIGLDETHKESRLTREELYQAVVQTALGLRALGVQKGDRVVAILPNIPETIIACLATSALGAIWASCSPEFGASAIKERFTQLNPAVLFTVDGYRYNAKIFDIREKTKKVQEGLKGLKKTVEIDFIGLPKNEYAEGMSFSQLKQPFDENFSFSQVDFDHPLFIMFSSGTTGVPKCIIHAHGRVLIQHKKEHQLHGDIKLGDRLCYFTTCGWMMWNWKISALASEACVVTYDGSPGYPKIDRLWEIADQYEITHLGTSPKYLRSCEDKGVSISPPMLQKLRVVFSTGSPLSANTAEWIYACVKSNFLLASISGGTDIIGCFFGGNPLGPVYAGEIQCSLLGMDTLAVDKQARQIFDQEGELVCRNVFPSMPIGFWNDETGLKYRKTYFEQIPNVWTHGDYISVNGRTGGIIMHGRSDATLNPGGVRIGTAEIYNIVENMEAVSDSLVVGIRENEDVSLVLFLVLHEKYKLDEALKKKIKETIRVNAGPRHVPRIIKSVPDIPRTMSGKKMETAVLNQLEGRPIDNKRAMQNPESLNAFLL